LGFRPGSDSRLALGNDKEAAQRGYKVLLKPHSWLLLELRPKPRQSDPASCTEPELDKDSPPRQTLILISQLTDCAWSLEVGACCPTCGSHGGEVP
jgi:hypothetical protein